MALVTQLTDDEVRAIAEDVLRRELGAFGFDQAEVRSGNDYSDEPAVYVRAVLKLGTPILGGKLSAKAHAALDRALMLRGETRFPYFSLHHPDGEDPEPQHWDNDAPS